MICASVFVSAYSSAIQISPSQPAFDIGGPRQNQNLAASQPQVFLIGILQKVPIFGGPRQIPSMPNTSQCIMTYR